MRRTLLVLSVAALMVAAMVVGVIPAFAAANNAGESLDNRNERSLQSNYGQCRSVKSLSASNEFNPNPNNSAEAACRVVGDPDNTTEGEPTYLDIDACESPPEEECPRLGPGQGSQG
jgi:hypothetical protein